MFYEISEENGFVFDYLKGLFTSELAKKKKQSASIKERVIEIDRKRRKKSNAIWLLCE
jgi:hypothetical protein